MGKLEALGRSLEESGKKMEAAEKSGDAAAQTAAAFEGLGTLLGGGKRVEPVSIDQLRPLVPETFAGLSKQSSNAERTGMAGIMVAMAEATYGDGADKSVTLEITDTGGASGLMGLASWAGVQGEKENDQMSERTERVDGRLVHQRVSKTGGTNEFSIVLGERFVVKAEGRGVDINALRGAVSGLDLPKLESMKRRRRREVSGYFRRLILRLRNSTNAPAGSSGCADWRPMAPDASLESRTSTTFAPL